MTEKGSTPIEMHLLRLCHPIILIVNHEVLTHRQFHFTKLYHQPLLFPHAKRINAIIIPPSSCPHNRRLLVQKLRVIQPEHLCTHMNLPSPFKASIDRFSRCWAVPQARLKALGSHLELKPEVQECNLHKNMHRPKIWNNPRALTHSYRRTYGLFHVSLRSRKSCIQISNGTLSMIEQFQPHLRDLAGLAPSWAPDKAALETWMEVAN